MPSQKTPTYHMKLSSPTAECGSVSRWPDHAVVSQDLFRVQYRKPSAHLCHRCLAVFKRLERIP